jgi:gamma-glutamyl:cysteine ligase YbdK (ATP-grasp superfamily)
MSSPTSPLHLFDAVGIELEYMIVDQASLNVHPIADQLLAAVAGEPVMSVERGPIAWSNELALHVIELKTNGPTDDLAAAAVAFQSNIVDMNATLAGLGARLLPTAMHPWMDPHRELRLWPHDDDVIYKTFDRIFDCRGHGWANLQSMHINLPFSGDAEFGHLHAAIRLLLPLLPALAASSPFQEGRRSGFADTRLVHYQSNARRIPSVSGKVIPEPVYTHAAYQALLESIYADLAPHDPDRVLCEEWVNARGAIARFDRGAIEIRVLDVQECPGADLTIAALVVATLRGLTERAAHDPGLAAWSEDRLALVLEACTKAGDAAWIEDVDYLEALTGRREGPRQALEVWRELAERAPTPWTAEQGRCLEHLLRHGCLSRRLDARLGPNPTSSALHAAYDELGACLAEGRLFGAP